MVSGCSVTDNQIRSLVGRRLVGTSSSHVVPPVLSTPPNETGSAQAARGGPAEPAGTVWAAVCSNGEVVFLVGFEDTDGEKTPAGDNSGLTVVKRLFLASWLAGRPPNVFQTAS